MDCTAVHSTYRKKVLLVDETAEKSISPAVVARRSTPR
jgi:hypothetical protein